MVLQRVTQPVDASEELAILNEMYTKILNWQDTVMRACYNPKYSAINFRMFVSTTDTYPQLLSNPGERVEIEVGLIRKNAGEVKESSATRFFKDMSGIETMVYESVFDKTLGRRRSFITAMPALSYPEGFDTNSSDRKRLAREAEAKRRKQFKDPRQMMQCPECGSNDILWDATPHCGNCHTVYPTVANIPASEITIEAEVHEMADDESWLNDWQTAPTEQRPAVVVVQAALPTTPVPSSPDPAPRLGKHPNGWTCDVCHQANKFVAIPTAYGTALYVCSCSE